MLRAGQGRPGVITQGGWHCQALQQFGKRRNCLGHVVDHIWHNLQGQAVPIPVSQGSDSHSTLPRESLLATTGRHLPAQPVSRAQMSRPLGPCAPRNDLIRKTALLPRLLTPNPPWAFLNLATNVLSLGPTQSHHPPLLFKMMFYSQPC